jgi:hypothetical protein
MQVYFLGLANFGIGIHILFPPIDWLVYLHLLQFLYIINPYLYWFQLCIFGNYVNSGANFHLEFGHANAL